MQETDISGYVNRRVEYHYRKATYRFDLSHALFSSAAVDAGTHLLLALIAAAERDATHRYARVVDLGCGTGALGVCLAGSLGVPLVAIDRDALAVDFTRHNCELNAIQDLQADAAIALPPANNDEPQLVVSNLPAKVGAPVLRFMVERILLRASAGGRAGFVIVAPLATLLTEWLERLGATVVSQKRTANHLAILADPSPSMDAPPDDAQRLPRAFIRTSATFQGPAKPYTLQTVHNVDEFDGLSFRTALAFDLMLANTLSGNIVVYGCGQGHLVQGVLQRSAPQTKIDIADRDVLALAATAAAATSVSAVHAVPGVGALVRHVDPHSLSWLIVNDDPTPGSAWSTDLRTVANTLLDDAGKLIVVSRSTTLARLLKDARGDLVELADRRMHGFRATLLRRRR